ncbi:MAG: DUF1232 domain-containing protein [Muribaculaceae bacterium]|nr:DUF1232 domain-containing protein [Muribaculaceae bacterium]
MAFNLNYFMNHLNRFKEMYRPEELFEKIKKVAKKAGIKVVYAVLVLYYASFDKSIPMKDRIMIMAALGYFICPIDLIPDALPGGFADDMGALAFVIKKIWNNITPEVFAKARKRLHEWFGEVSPEDLTINP